MSAFVLSGCGTKIKALARLTASVATTPTASLTCTPGVAPTVTGVSPATVSTLGGGTLTVNGTNLCDTSVITINGIPCSGVTAVSGSQVTCTIPTETAATYDVTVTNSDSLNDTLVAAVTYTGTPTCPQAAAQYFTGGDGLSTGTAYHVSNYAGLRAIRYCLSSYFKLMNDLDLTGQPNERVIPGTFTGQFDGQNHTISNYTYNDATASPVQQGCGLFDRPNGSTIKNLTLSNFNFSNCLYPALNWSGGALAFGTVWPNTTMAPGTTFSNITVNAFSASGDRNLGGLIGVFAPGTAPNFGTFDTIRINNPTFTCIASGYCANPGASKSLGWGGFIGNASYVSVYRAGVSNFTSPNDQIWRTGGLIGTFGGAGNTISQSFARSNLTYAALGGNNDRVGGLIGYNGGVTTATVSDSYVEMATTNLWQNGGGFIGDTSLGGGSSITIDRFIVSSFTSTNTQSGGFWFGGVVGVSTGTSTFAGTNFIVNNANGTCEKNGGACGAAPGTLSVSFENTAWIQTPASYPAGTWLPTVWNFQAGQNPRLAWEP